MLRRNFIQNMIHLAFASLSSLLLPKMANATWSTEKFASGEFALRFEQAFAGQSINNSSDIHIQLPNIAENGAVVPFTIDSDLEQIEHLYIWVDKNPTPLAAEFELSEKVVLPITGRIKMAESANVIVIAKQGERLLRSQKWVNVMQGGCGTG